MPIYEFKCDACDLVFEELFRSAGEKRRMQCPQCGTRDVRKLLSAFRTGGGDGGGSAGCGGCTASSCASCS